MVDSVEDSVEDTVADLVFTVGMVDLVDLQTSVAKGAH